MNRLSGLFHKKIHSLWNRPESLFLRMVQDVRFNQKSVMHIDNIYKPAPSVG